MILHDVRVHPERDRLPPEHQLARRLAEVAADPVPIEPAVTDEVINRLIDNAAVAVASLDRHPVVTARDQALAHPRPAGATLFGCPDDVRVHAEWAAWANATAVRELDFHDTFLAADYSHPGDNIPPLLAVAQQTARDGAALIRAIVTAYEIQVDLVRAICLHRHKIDHVAHLGPSVAAGLGTLLDLPVDRIHQSINQALHVTTATRQSRKGEISSWKAFAPAHAGKLAIESVDRAMRGEAAPSPIYEGEDSVIAWLLDGPDAHYQVPLPARGEPKRAILDTYTKEHSAEYQSQALIDLAFALRRDIQDWDQVDDILIETSHHTHNVIGTGANDPQKFDSDASRETLDHSIMYIVAVALQDGAWHHVRSYAPDRARRPDTIRLWRKIRTTEDPAWTERYHSQDPATKAFGGRITIRLADGRTIAGERAVADAHPLGATPWTRAHYIRKFRTLTEDLLPAAETTRFLDLVQNLPTLSPADLAHLNPTVPKLQRGASGIF